MSFTLRCFSKKPVQINTERYRSGQLYVELVVENEPYAALSICLPELELADDEFVFKTYSENEGLYEKLIEASVVELVRVERHPLGLLPICRLKGV